MMMNAQKESMDVAVLREKIRLKKIDRKVYVEEMENLLTGNRQKRNALRIGNDCLRFMTRRQNNMSVAINTSIFENRPREEKFPMATCDLQKSIVKNDSKLFKYGKQLMKSNNRVLCAQRKKKFYQEELARAEKENIARMEEFKSSCERFLSAQVRVEDYKSREVSAKLVFQNLQKILVELEKDLKAFPDKIKAIEDKIKRRKSEVEDFLELKAGALRFLNIEESELVPLNEELKAVNNHFEKILSAKKQELDERRKNNSLDKFLSERESAGFNFTGSSNITEMKIQARNNALINTREMLLQLMDAMIVSDVKFVVDCIRDQEDVTKLLLTEKENRLLENAVLLSELQRLTHNNEVLKYKDIKQAKVRLALQNSKRVEQQEKKRYEDVEMSLRKQDRLMSDVKLSLHAMFERLRPVKLEDEYNLYVGTLLDDTQNFIRKISMMNYVIEKRTVPVGRVKPLMLHLFKEKRIPADSIRVETAKESLHGHMQALEAFESIQPGFTSREMLKQRAQEIAAKHKKVKAP